MVDWKPLAIVAGLVASTVAPARAEPFIVRNQHPIVMIHGLPAPLPARLAAPRTGRMAVLMNWANFATTEARGANAYTLDGEAVEARLTLDRALGEGFALHGELAWRSLSAGSLDGTIEQFHDTLGLPNGSRKKLPDDQLLLEYRVGDTVPFRVDRDAAGITDLPLALGYQVRASATSALAAWISVKLPTGKAENLTGSGATDVALSLAGERRLGERWHAFGQANVAWLGEGDLLPALQEDLAWSLLGGTSWNAWHGLDFTVQLEANSAVLDSRFDDFDGGAVVLTFGGSYRTDGGWHFDLGISEDIQSDASPDVVFNVAVRHGF